jgi:probable rRNA maturation factor
MVSLTVTVTDTAPLPPATRRRLRIELARMARAAARRDHRDDYDVAVAIVDDRAIRALNHSYRGKDKPTDVLAFAQRDTAHHASPTLLGDIVISLATARRQARRGLHAELLHLASHGLCHLLGYDHRDDDEERAMNTRARALRDEAARRGRIRAA